MVVAVVKHAKVVDVPDDGTSPVGTDEWNAEHVVTGIENVDNTSDADKPVSTATQAALDLKLNAANPVITGTIKFGSINFAANIGGGVYNGLYDGSGRLSVLLGGTADSGNYYRNAVHFFQSVSGTVTFATLGASGMAFLASPTAPTPTAGDSTTKLATTAFVGASIDALIGGAPGTLDTLNELAAAINDDASYAAAVTSALALKAPLASPAFTGSPTAPIPLTTDNSSRIATTAFYVGRAATATPAAPGAAAVGTSTRFAREDHVHAPPSVSQLTDSAWSTWVPTFAWGTPGSTPATFTINSARYKQIGKLVFFTLDVVINNVGVGNGAGLSFVLPIAPVTGFILTATGKESNLTGNLLAIQGSGTTDGYVQFYNNTSLISAGNNSRSKLGGFYEAA